MGRYSFLITSFFIFGIALAQDLHQERIWKVSDSKRSIFIDRGIFHSTLEKSPRVLTNLRTSFDQRRGYERIVFDFDGNTPAKIYGHVSSEDKILRVDLFNTSISAKMVSKTHGKFLESVDFYNVNDSHLGVELRFKKNVNFDLFYLTNPGRFVVDVNQ